MHAHRDATRIVCETIDVNWEFSMQSISSVIIDWVENDMDPWFYTAMRLRPLTKVGLSIKNNRNYTSCNLGGSRTLGFVECTETGVMVSQLHVSEIRVADSTTISYSDPNLFESIKSAIRRVYNSQ